MAARACRALVVLLATVAWLGSSWAGSSWAGWSWAGSSRQATAWAAGPAEAAAPWTWPLGGPDAVTRPFAPPPHRYGAGHRGVDLVALPGAAVRAAGPGRVAYSGLLAGRGVVVVVHGDLRTTYEPVTATVGVGTRVAAGEVIGTLESGHAGCPAAACLHWGLRRGEDYLDPVRLVDRGPVRLLPVGPPPVGPPPVGLPAVGPPPVGRGPAGDDGPPRPPPGAGDPPVTSAGGAPPHAAHLADAPPVAARLDASAAAVALSAGAALTAVAVRRRAR